MSKPRYKIQKTLKVTDHRNGVQHDQTLTVTAKHPEDAQKLFEAYWDDYDHERSQAEPGDYHG